MGTDTTSKSPPTPPGGGRLAFFNPPGSWRIGIYARQPATIPQMPRAPVHSHTKQLEKTSPPSPQLLPFFLDQPSSVSHPFFTKEG